MISRLLESATAKPVLRYGLVFFCGALGAFGMAPYYFWPLLIFALSGLFALSLTAGTASQLFWCGWSFGFGYFVSGLWWIGNALLVDGNPYVWAWPLAVAALPAILAIFTGLAMIALRFARSRRNFLGFLAFCSAIFLAEMGRSTLFTGFPWNLYAHAWGETLPMLQILSLSNIHVLNALTIIAFALPGYVLINRSLKRHQIAVMAVIMACFIGLYVWGAHRLSATQPGFHDDIQIMIVQPSIKQEDKWASNKFYENYDRLLGLSQMQGEGNTNLIIWPETAISYLHTETPEIMLDMGTALSINRNDTYLITGHLNRDKHTETFQNRVSIYNKRADLIAAYDKHHLVPFGEYVPFQEYIPIPTVTQFSGFETGPGPQTLSISGDISISPIVCYESIFSGNVIDPQKPPALIVNVTNDAWYGVSPGPYQHAAQSRFRAIEEGIPVARSANTGVSVLYDALGRELVSADLFEITNIQSALPRDAHTDVFYKPYINMILSAFALVFLFLSTRKRENIP